MNRLEKVNQQLKREISWIIQRELHDPRLEFVSITHARVSPDLRQARVYFSVLGDAKKAEAAQNGLDSAKGLIRRIIGRQMKMRFTPELSFHFDDSSEIHARIDQALKDIHNEESKGYQEDFSDDQAE